MGRSMHFLQTTVFWTESYRFIGLNATELPVKLFLVGDKSDLINHC